MHGHLDNNDISNGLISRVIRVGPAVQDWCGILESRTMSLFVCFLFPDFAPSSEGCRHVGSPHSAEVTSCIPVSEPLSGRILRSPYDPPKIDDADPSRRGYVSDVVTGPDWFWTGRFLVHSLGWTRVPSPRCDEK